MASVTGKSDKHCHIVLLLFKSQIHRINTQFMIFPENLVQIPNPPEKQNCYSILYSYTGCITILYPCCIWSSLEAVILRGYVPLVGTTFKVWCGKSVIIKQLHMEIETLDFLGKSRECTWLPCCHHRGLWLAASPPRLTRFCSSLTLLLRDDHREGMAPVPKRFMFMYCS